MLERGWIVALLLAAQGLAAYSIGSWQTVPAAPSDTAFPTRFATWHRTYDEPIAADVRKQLGADLLVNKHYSELAGSVDLSLLIAWFQSQTDGVRQPHSPKVCLPGSGWLTEFSDEVTLSEGVAVNRYVVSNGPTRDLIVYWYQTPRRVIASEWSAKWWTIADALRDQRTDIALVRLVVPLPASGHVEEATATALRFGRTMYPELRQYLPR